ncbi:uncharacterized protein V6R79_009773 [Siganus canaliculatus]
MPGWRRNLTFCLQRMHEEDKVITKLSVGAESNLRTFCAAVANTHEEEEDAMRELRFKHQRQLSSGSAAHVLTLKLRGFCFLQL